MELYIRELNETDYDEILVGWWKDWGWNAPPKDFLPRDGRGGIMIMDEDIPVCAGFMYLSNSKLSCVDFIISNRNYKKKPQRKQSIDLLIAALTQICKDSGSKYVFALLKHSGLIGVYEKLGYVKGDNYTAEMIKKL